MSVGIGGAWPCGEIHGPVPHLLPAWIRISFPPILILYSFKDAVETTECVEWTTAVILGASAKLMKATVSFLMSACPSVRMHGATRLLLHVKFCIGFY
jgi:hypothetical protein